MNNRVFNHNITTGNGKGYGTNVYFGDGIEGNGLGSNIHRDFTKEFQLINMTRYKIFHVEILYE